MLEYLVNVDLPWCTVDIPRLYFTGTATIVRSVQYGEYHNTCPEYLTWTLKDNIIYFGDDETVVEFALPSEPQPVGIKVSEYELYCLDILRNDGTVQIVGFKEDQTDDDDDDDEYTSMYTIKDYGLGEIEDMASYVRWFLE